MSEVKLEMINIPLPTEIPQPPSLDQVPVGILHSATTEMLIQQNEDLAARLKVNIRRNSLLEQKILELENQLQASQRQKENLVAQNQVLKEREDQWQNKKKAAEGRVGSLESEIKLLELRYHELQASIRGREKESLLHLERAREQAERAEQRLLKLKTIKERAKDRLRLFLWQTAQRQAQQSHDLQKAQAESQLAINSCRSLEEQVQRRETEFRDHLHKMKNTSLENIRLLQSEKNQLETKCSSLEEKQRQHESELFELKEKLFIEQKLRVKVSQLSQDLAELRNERVQNRRALHDKDLEFAQALQMEQEGRKRAEQETLERDKQIFELKSALEVCEIKLIEFSRDNKDLSQRLEVTQKLWLEAQDRLEKEEAKSQSLQKLNAELAKSSLDQRVDRSLQKAHSPTYPTSPGPQLDV